MTQVAVATKFEQVPIGKLVPYANNTRMHSAGQVEKIAQSIRQFGFVAPIIISSGGEIIAGHGRVLAAQKIGLETVPCVRAEHLTKKQWRAYSIADNRLTELGSWDADKLASELADLKLDLDLTITGFSEVEILELLSDDDELEKAASEASTDPVKFEQPVQRVSASTLSPQAVSAENSVAKGIPPDAKSGFMVVGYCETYAQQLDAMNALRVLGIKCVAK